MVTRILVVDDESYVRDLLQRVLTRRGHEVDVAADGETALELMQAHTYDLVLTDVVMPGIDGFDLLRRVKATYPAVTVIVLTGYARKQSISDFLLYGADEYLSKPFQVQALLDSVDRVVGDPASSSESAPAV
jgi:CheY-like chemotaxis protein